MPLLQKISQRDLHAIRDHNAPALQIGERFFDLLQLSARCRRRPSQLLQRGKNSRRLRTAKCLDSSLQILASGF